MFFLHLAQFAKRFTVDQGLNLAWAFLFFFQMNIYAAYQQQNSIQMVTDTQTPDKVMLSDGKG